MWYHHTLTSNWPDDDEGPTIMWPFTVIGRAKWSSFFKVGKKGRFKSFIEFAFSALLETKKSLLYNTIKQNTGCPKKVDTHQMKFVSQNINTYWTYFIMIWIDQYLSFLKNFISCKSDIPKWNYSLFCQMRLFHPCTNWIKIHQAYLLFRRR